MSTKIEHTMLDVEAIHNKAELQHTVHIALHSKGVSIGVQGYGSYESDDKDGIAYLEVQDGKLFLFVWTDINNPEPTKISLENAKIIKRKT